MRYATGSVIGIETLFLDQLKVPIITADGKITVRRLSDDLYFDGTFTAGVPNFIATPTLLSMSKVGDADSPGWWKFDFDTSKLSSDDYVFTITDANALAKNVPQLSKAIVGDLLALAIESGAAGAVGKVVYNEETSILDLYEWDDSTTIFKSFDMKDINGSPAGTLPFFQKIPG